MTRALCLFLLCSACAPFPLQDSAPSGLKTPPLLPNDQIAQPAAAIIDDPLAARTAALQTRANALRALP